MRRSKFVAVAFYLGAVVVGAAIGIAIDRAFVGDRIDRVTGNRGAAQDRFFADLSLTPAQRASWDSVQRAARRTDSVLFAPLRAQIDPLFAQLMPQRDSIRKARETALRALLTPEQQTLYDARRRQRSNGDRK